MRTRRLGSAGPEITTVGFGEKTQDRLNIDPLVHQQVLLTSNEWRDRRR